MYEDIEYEVEESELRATVRFDRPEKMNALSERLLEELCDALERAEANEDVRAVVLTGNGEAFSTGYDLSTENADDVDPVPSADDLLESMESTTGHLKTIWDLYKPVVVAVNGHCLAGGSDLAMASDVVIASDKATFGYPGQRMAGHPPALTYPFFMGFHQAKELLYTGKTVDADRAMELGVFNRVVPHEDLLDEAYAEVDAIKKVPGTGIRVQKQTLNAVAEQQGFRSTLLTSEHANALAHLTDLGSAYYEAAMESDDLSSSLTWMNERDKRMRDLQQEDKEGSK